MDREGSSARQFSVFLSSTAQDLGEHRLAVLGALGRLDGVTTVHQESFGARGGETVAECTAMAREADVLVVVAAYRYGWVPTVEEGGDDDRSITRLEVDAAIDAGRRILVFLVDPEHPWALPKEQDDPDAATSPARWAEVGRRVQLLGEFRRELAERPRELFADPADLAAKVTTAVTNELNRFRVARTQDRPDTRVDSGLRQAWQLRPPAPPAHFCGRELEADRITALLRENSIVLLVGLSGVGKTTLAAEVAHRMLHAAANEVLWVTGDIQSEEVLVDVVGAALGVAYGPSRATVAARARALTEDRGHLIIFDGFNNDQLLEIALSMIGEGNRVLITSTDFQSVAASRRGATRLELNPLSDTESGQVVQELLGAPDPVPDAWIENVVRAAAGMPFALELFTEELRSVMEVTPTSSVARVLEQSVPRHSGSTLAHRLSSVVSRFDADERSAFASVGVLAHNVAPCWLIVALCSDYVSHPEDFIGLLRRYLLVGRSESGDLARIHSITIEVCRTMLRELPAVESKARTTYARVLTDRVNSFGGYEWNVSQYPRLLDCELEVLSLLDRLALEQAESPDDVLRWERLAIATFQFSWYLYWRGLFDTRRLYCQRVLASRPPSEKLDTSYRSVLGNLTFDVGWTLLRSGDFRRATELADSAVVLLTNLGDLYFAEELRAECSLVAGDRFKAIDDYRAIVDRLMPSSRPWFVLSMRLYRALGGPGEPKARDLLHELAEAADSCGLGENQGMLDVAATLYYQRAELALSAGRDRDAAELAQMSVDRFEESGKLSASRVYATAILAESSTLDESVRSGYHDQAESLASQIRISSPFSAKGPAEWVDLVG
jgi:hypothetical protein